MRNVFDFIEDVAPRSGWTPDTPPQLDGIHDIYLNFETTGLRWWDGDQPISCSLMAGDKTYYLPWRHAGGNLDEAVVKRWAQRELRGKHIRNINTRFDIHMGRVWDVDLEAQGNTVSDIGHYAALLDDHRMHFSLDHLIKDILAEDPMPRLDESRMASYHAEEAAPRSIYNVVAVKSLHDAFWPELTKQNLQPIRALEDQVIYVVCEMEKNGAPIDEELLDRWLRESQAQLNGYLLQIARELGWQCNPDSPKDMQRAFLQLKLPIVRTSKGSPSFTDAVLKEIKHPTIQLIRKAGKLASLKSKFIDNTKKMMGRDGILRYALHQLRTTKDEQMEGGEAGAVTGRFSSSALGEGTGVNIQQRMKAARQRLAFGYDEKDSSHDDEIFLVRKLHIPGSGLLLSSDMDQAQYRIFASYAGNPRVIAAYRENPKLSFHDFMHNLLNPFVSMSYRQQKDLNFAYLFGAGTVKMALMMGFISAQEFNDIRDREQWDHPKLAETKKIKSIYERELPEVKELLDRAMHLAKPKCDDRCKMDELHRTTPHRGYVCTAGGRRMRFPNGQRLHKAFNGVDQGTEADYMKQKLVELHALRKETGFVLRITNHDEVVGDIPDKEHAAMVDEILNHQSFPQLEIPMTWTTGVGPNWAACEDFDDSFGGAARTRAKQNITDLHRIGINGVRGE